MTEPRDRVRFKSNFLIYYLVLREIAVVAKGVPGVKWISCTKVWQLKGCGWQKPPGENWSS